MRISNPINCFRFEDKSICPTCGTEYISQRGHQCKGKPPEQHGEGVKCTPEEWHGWVRVYPARGHRRDGGNLS